MKRPSFDDDTPAIFDAEGSFGDARASLCSLGGAIENCSAGGRVYGPFKVEEQRDRGGRGGSEEGQRPRRRLGLSSRRRPRLDGAVSVCTAQVRGPCVGEAARRATRSGGASSSYPRSRN